jgi:hypothetical protein
MMRKRRRRRRRKIVYTHQPHAPDDRERRDADA